MNVLELEENLTKKAINFKSKDIAKLIGIDETSYSRKKRLGSEIKRTDLKKIEQFYNIWLEQTHKELDNNVMIKYYENACAAAGNGGFGSDSFELVSINQSFIRGFNPNNEYSIINCVGDSMYPLLMPDDFLIVKNSNTINDNHIHVFYYEDKMYVKFLANNIDQIVIKSVNPDYPTRYADNVNVIGEVVGCVRKL